MCTGAVGCIMARVAHGSAGEAAASSKRMDATHISSGEPRLLISRSALLHNARLLRQTVAAGVRICAIIKADAYGHGAAIVVDALAERDESGRAAIDALAVACTEEAAALPAVELPILIFRPVEEQFGGRQRASMELAIGRNWTLTVCSAAAAEDVARTAVAMERRASVQIMVDTGMTRSGVDAAAARELVATVQSKPALRLAGLCTHFARSEEAANGMTQRQLAGFLEITDPVVKAAAQRGGRPPLRHAANSAAVFLHPASHLDMVRPGISLYGIDPTGRPSAARKLRPAMKWVAPLLMIRAVRAGTAVGYGQTWTSPRDTRIGLVPVGYADGYLRALSNRASVIVHGQAAPVVGRVSMDLLTIDLGDVPAARVGDDVVLLDDDPLSPASVYALARHADTIPYEIFCRIGPRVRRIVVGAAAESARR